VSCSTFRRLGEKGGCEKVSVCVCVCVCMLCLPISYQIRGERVQRNEQRPHAAPLLRGGGTVPHLKTTGCVSDTASDEREQGVHEHTLTPRELSPDII
jgi:hypothetical protein